MFCPSCGASLRELDKFCGKCGQEVHLEASDEGDLISPAQDPAEAPTPEVVDLFSSSEISKISNQTDPDVNLSSGAAKARTSATTEENIEVPTYSSQSIEERSTKGRSTAEILGLSNSAETSSPKGSSRGIYIGVSIASVILASVITWVFVFSPILENQKAQEIAATEARREARLAAEKEEQERVAAEERKAAEILSAFEAAKESGRITDLGKFVQKYPDSTYAVEAQQLANASLKRQKSSIALKTFQKWFPTSDTSFYFDESPEEDITTQSGSWSGQFNSSGRPTGSGIAKFPDDATFSGTYYNNGTAKGIYTYPDGDIYEGSFKTNPLMVTGRGTFTITNGNIYTGDVDTDSFHGKGELKFASGARYKGDFLRGKLTGKGVYFYSNGGMYDGDMLDNQRHGRGTLKFADGGQYTGDFVQGERTGKGVLTFEEGDRYEGDFIANQMTGRGSYIYADGARYDGEFLDGKFNGLGTLTYSDGTRQKGRFENDEFIK